MSPPVQRNQAAGLSHTVTADDVEEGEVDALVQGLLKAVTAEGFEDCFKAKVWARMSVHLRPEQEFNMRAVQGC